MMQASRSATKAIPQGAIQPPMITTWTPCAST